MKVQKSNNAGRFRNATSHVNGATIGHNSFRATASKDDTFVNATKKIFKKNEPKKNFGKQTEIVRDFSINSHKSANSKKEEQQPLPSAKPKSIRNAPSSHPQHPQTPRSFGVKTLEEMVTKSEGPRPSVSSPSSPTSNFVESSKQPSSIENRGSLSPKRKFCDISSEDPSATVVVQEETPAKKRCVSQPLPSSPPVPAVSPNPDVQPETSALIEEDIDILGDEVTLPPSSLPSSSSLPSPKEEMETTDSILSSSNSESSDNQWSDLDEEEFKTWGLLNNNPTSNLANTHNSASVQLNEDEEKELFSFLQENS